jgi:hypothetical protein
MNYRFQWVLWIIGLILVGNFVALMIYGDTLKSTHLFIVRGTVFYPLAYLNLVSGMGLITLLALGKIFKKNRK